MVGDRTQKSVVFQKLLAGHTDEIVDMKFLPNLTTTLAVATNSEQLRLFNIEERTTTILNGHTDTILGIGKFSKEIIKQNKHKITNKPLFEKTDVCIPPSWRKNAKCWLLTCAKDSTVRLWEQNSQTGKNKIFKNNY